MRHDVSQAGLHCYAAENRAQADAVILVRAARALSPTSTRSGPLGSSASVCVAVEEPMP